MSKTSLLFLTLPWPRCWFWLRAGLQPARKKRRGAAADPWSFVPKHPIHTDHSSIVQGPFEAGQDVTRACLECHAYSAGGGLHAYHGTGPGRASHLTSPGTTSQ